MEMYGETRIKKKDEKPGKPVKKEEPQGTMAEKLAMLKGKFR